MVAYLKKSDDNKEFHQIVDFLSSCSITYDLTVSLTIYAFYIERFWNTAISKTIISMKQIHALVDGKAVVISESLVISDLLFDDEDGITCLPIDEIFENLALMGYEPLSTKLTFQKGGSPKRQETIGGTSAQTMSERVLEHPNEPPLTEESYTPGSDEGRITLAELMETCTTLSNRERIIKEMDKDKNINLVSKQGEVQETAEHSRDDDDETLAETLLNIKRSSAKDREKKSYKRQSYQRS
nr:hypothetical protein [Tanacetum cinerariifolium]